MFPVEVDTYLKWLDVQCLKSTTSSATTEKPRENITVCNSGLPSTLVSDNGSDFASSEFQEFMNRSRIRHIKVAQYHSTSSQMGWQNRQCK